MASHERILRFSIKLMPTSTRNGIRKLITFFSIIKSLPKDYSMRGESIGSQSTARPIQPLLILCEGFGTIGPLASYFFILSRSGCKSKLNTKRSPDGSQKASASKSRNNWLLMPSSNSMQNIFS